MATIGLVANVYNEANALPGWLETHLPLFDDVRVYHAGPGGALSDDGTIEILEKWRIPYTAGSIDDGFGVVRTAAVRYSPCDWVMILDCDERFYRYAPILSCTGNSTPREVVDNVLYDYGNPNYHKDEPRNKRQVFQEYDQGIKFKSCPSNFENLQLLGADLSVTCKGVYNQEETLRGIINDAETGNAIKIARRHWHDFSFKRPTQNWHTDPDWQARCIRNRDGIYFAPDIRMHEKLIGASDIYQSNHLYLDHFHCFFKCMEPEQRGHDIAIYGAVDRNERPPTREEWSLKGKV